MLIDSNEDCNNSHHQFHHIHRNRVSQIAANNDNSQQQLSSEAKRICVTIFIIMFIIILVTIVGIIIVFVSPYYNVRSTAPLRQWE
jgi:hypothetical protein